MRCTARCPAPLRWAPSVWLRSPPTPLRSDCYGPIVLATPTCGRPGSARATTPPATSRCCWPQPVCSAPELDGPISSWRPSWLAWRCRAPGWCCGRPRANCVSRFPPRCIASLSPLVPGILPAERQREPSMLERTPPQFRELQEISMQTDTRDILAHATRQAESHEDYFLVDIDAHVTETSFWPEILAMIDNDVIRQMGQANAERPGNANVSLLNNQPGILHQHVWGRIPHQQALMEKVEKKGSHHFVELARRSMDALGLDYQIVFPTPMLTLGMHPQD